ncbi:MAG TPA: flagellar basal body P-ring protein FlgI [Brevundimonas sp.]|nr:flagellar basal body P-ring protein FlgI [Brevundimonas sp.]
MRLISAAMAVILSLTAPAALAQTVQLRDLGRLQGWRDTALVGYGIVTGLTGTGDSPRNAVTQRAVSNALGRLGSNLSPEDIRSRNVAAVMVTAVLPPSANVGDRIDVTVTSLGDSRSLSGGVLLMTPLMGPDQQPYALAQGPLVVGGFQFASQQNSEQRNVPTAGVISGGATIEVGTEARTLESNGDLVFVLREPSFITAVRIVDAINASGTGAAARVGDADMVRIDTRGAPDLFRLIAAIEALPISPATVARVVVNERTGTVVAGGDVRLSSVSVSQGDIRVSVRQRNEASQPVVYGGRNDDLTGLIVRNTSIEVTEDKGDAVVTFPNTTVGDLMEGLARVGVDTRGKIAVLQAIRAAGALHADIVVQ